MDLSNTTLGIELGSTRIKAVLTDHRHRPLASGAYSWESVCEQGIWTYSWEAIHTGVRACFQALKEDFFRRYHEPLRTAGAMGVSAMMHGYLAFDKSWQPLAPFRTWRNTCTGPAAEALSALLGCNIPQRWSIAHLYQAMLNGEAHVERIAHLTTLAGYVHHLLTGENVLGVGDASGMFPISDNTLCYDAQKLKLFEQRRQQMGYDWQLAALLPAVLPAGEQAGTLCARGAAFLDPSGEFQPGIPLCPPEGDAGTGMTATNSVRVHTGNVSAGTSAFAMLVTDHPLAPHREIDMVTTPDGKPVAMVHCNTCTADINAWVRLFCEFSALMGTKVSPEDAFDRLFRLALEGQPDGGGLLSFNCLAGEGITGLDAGRPLFVRTPDAAFSLADFMRAHMMSALATLKLGLDLLIRQEGLRIDRLTAHGGFFKTPAAGQRLLAAAVNAPVSVLETAGEGGPYGMALLSAYMLRRQQGETLPDYLEKRVFSDAQVVTIQPDSADVTGFLEYLARYTAMLPVQAQCVQSFPAQR